MKLLISPGLPRSGTTYIYKQLTHGGNAELFNIPKSKEMNFFFNNINRDEFLSAYKIDNPEKYFLDFSPSYMMSRLDVVGNIRAFPSSEVKVIINLRHPVEQAYAHYLHDLKAHVARREYGNDVFRPMFSEDVVGRYVRRRAQCVEAFIAAFGVENIFVINFHTDLNQPGLLSEKIGRFLGVELHEFANELVGPGGWLPYYIYGGATGIEIVFGTDLIFVPSKTMILVNGAESELWANVDENTAAKLMFGAASWTREIVAEQFSQLWRVFSEDWKRTLLALGKSESEYVATPPLIPRPARLSQSIAKQLQKTSTLSDRLVVGD